MDIQSIVLEGEHVRLEPLSMEHHAALCQVALDPDLWRWTIAQIRNPEELSAYMDQAIRERDQGSALPFATVAKDAGRAIGSTRFGNIDPHNRRAEIGWTWIGRDWQRTAVNTEAKLLMLRHAFETWGCVRVELKTDALNERSRTAIRRIGAQEEGIFRKHMLTESGRWRDSVFHSVVDSEWPEAKARLERMLEQGPTGMRPTRTVPGGRDRRTSVGDQP